MRLWASLASALAAAVLLVGSGNTDLVVQERLTRLRNLGKAFYENPTTQAQAIEQFKQAVELSPNSTVDRLNYGLSLLRAGKQQQGVAELLTVQKADPKIPHTWFNLGIEFKKQGETEKSLEQFEGMQKLVPDEPITQYNLGVLYKLLGREDEAIAKFRRAAELDPNLAAAHFQIFNALRQAGKREEAQKELQLFQETKKNNEVTNTTEDVEWSVYSEVLDVVDASSSAEEVPAPGVAKFTATAVPGKVDVATVQVLANDFDGDGTTDVLVLSAAGGALYRKGVGPADPAGLGDLKGFINAAAADFDNDGLLDLCIITDKGAALYKNQKGKFVKIDANLPHRAFRVAAFVDYDHDFDMDLVLLGDEPALLRNQGEAGWVDRTADFPFVAGKALEALNFRWVPDSKSLDLVVSYEDHEAVLYSDQLAGHYKALRVAEVPAGARSLRAVDLNNDGWVDVAYSTAQGTSVALNHAQKWTIAQITTARGFAIADLQNNGLADVVVGGTVLPAQGNAKFGQAKKVDGLGEAAALATADFDGDGRLDLFSVKPDGSLARFTNQTLTKNQWLRVKLAGIKNLKIAPGSEVEVKSGLLYQKKIYDGAPLLFGMRGYHEADTVRITWPNGLIQNEMKQLTGKLHSYEEAQRLSGSCPVIWTWNGREYEYITDVLGVAPLGASSGDGKYFPVDHDEYVSIRGESLRARDGKYEVRITEELSEVSYLDQVKLLAVDHPADVEVFSNDKWKSPPFPEFRLFGAKKRIAPLRATDDDGSDATAKVLKKDRRYADGFRRSMTGVASMHHLDVDFGNAAADNRAVLVLSGWVDWADGSTFLSEAQKSKEGLMPPKLQVRNDRGEWVTVLEDMGMPAGKPKTIAVDMTGKFLSKSREVRIVTNLCVMWDEIFLSEDSTAPAARLTEIASDTADLHFRGFSPARIHARHEQPEEFFYQPAMAMSMWNPTPGMYTRYGTVNPLVRDVDDKLVIMGSGDELTLQFDERQFPALPAGWRRDYLLKVDGWAKDRDANTAYSQTVEPLPFHGMSSYPYPANESYPADEAHASYRKSYNTRPALRLLRPLNQSGTESIRTSE
jgi:tetratricopeptide (TPR) repeat protein